MATETRVRVSIEADKATGAVQAAGEELKKFGEDAKAAGEQAKKGAEGTGLMGEAADELSGQLQALVGGAAIAAFFKGAVEASLEEAESLRQVKFAVESTGGAWGSYKDKIDAFAASQQAATQFDDGVTIQVLGKLTRAIGDVDQAMKATALAQDIAAASGKELSDTTRIVSDLMTGQERGLSMARKEFGAYVGEAKNGQEALDALSKAFEGAAESQDGATKTVAQAKNAFGEFQQQVGDGVVPVFVGLLKVLSLVIKGWEELGAAAAGVMAAVVVGAQGVSEAMSAAFSGNFTEAVRVARQTKDQLAGIADETGQNIEAIEDRYASKKIEKVTLNAQLVAKASQDEMVKAAEERQKIEQQLSEDLLKVKADTFEMQRIKLNEQVEAARQAGVDNVEIKRLEGEEIVSLEEFKQERLKQIGAEETAKNAEVSKKKVDEAKKLEKGQQDIEKDRKANFAATMQFISSLSTAKNKELAILGKAAALASAYINTAAAITVALRSAPPPFNFALAAAVGAAGAVQIATIAGVQLEKGGVTTGTGQDGIFANIGEKGKPEAVLPLTDRAAMAMVGRAIADARGGGGGGDVTNIFNLSVMAGPTWREIVDALIEAADRDPEMIRLARKLGDLNELHAGRAS